MSPGLASAKTSCIGSFNSPSVFGFVIPLLGHTSLAPFSIDALAAVRCNLHPLAAHACPTRNNNSVCSSTFTPLATVRGKMYYSIDMTEVAYIESKKDLLKAAKKARFEVSERQLVRWQNSGLLPRPRRRFLGRGRGSEAVYPEGATQRLLAICRIHQSDQEKRLDYVLWRLWWEGHNVDIKRVRQFLRDVA